MFYGWILLPALCLVYGLAIGPAFYGFGVALPSTAEMLDLSRTEASATFSLLVLLLGLTAPLVAILMRRIGTRLTMTVGAVLLVAGAVLVAVGDSFITYLLGAGVLMGFGLGALTVLPGTSLINVWFVRRRALAMGLFLTAGGLGGFAAAAIIAPLIVSAGPRSAWWLIAGTSLAAGVIAFVFVRESPAAMGQLPDGAEASASADGQSAAAKPSRVYHSAVDWPVAKALRSPVFWIIVAGYTIFGLGLQLANSQIVAHLTGIGVVATLAASALGTMALVSALSRLVGGLLGDLIEPRFLLAAGLAGQVVGMLLLTTATSPVQIYSAVILFGGGYGIAYLSVPPLVANYFGAGSYPALFGIAMPVGTVIGAGGPILAGIVYDATSSYTTVFIGFAIAAAVIAVIAPFLRPPRPTPAMASDGADATTAVS